jgi:hypothetical protein
VIAREHNNDRGTAQLIQMEYLGIKKVCAEMVPKNRSVLEEFVLIFCDKFRRIMKGSTVITGDVSWGFQYDSGRKQWGMQWKSPGSQENRCQNQSQDNVNLFL